MPGSAQRILDMSEKALVGHIDRDHKLADAEIELGRNGQAMAFTLTLIALITAVVFFLMGNEVAGLAFVSLPVVMLIRSFLPGKADPPQLPPEPTPPPTSEQGPAQ